MFAKFAIATAAAALLAMAAGQSANAQVISQKVPSGTPGSTTMQAPSVPTSSTMKVPRPTNGTMQAPVPAPRPTNGTMQAPAPRPAPAPAPQTQSLPVKR